MAFKTGPRIGSPCGVRTYLVDQIFCSSNPLISWLRQMEALETAASLARSHTVEGSVWLCSCISPPED